MKNSSEEKKGLILNNILIILPLYMDVYVYEQAYAHILLSENIYYKAKGWECNKKKKTITYNRKPSEVCSVSQKHADSETKLIIITYMQ